MVSAPGGFGTHLSFQSLLCQVDATSTDCGRRSLARNPPNRGIQASFKSKARERLRAWHDPRGFAGVRHGAGELELAGPLLLRGLVGRRRKSA